MAPRAILLAARIAVGLPVVMSLVLQTPHGPGRIIVVLFNSAVPSGLIDVTSHRAVKSNRVSRLRTGIRHGTGPAHRAAPLAGAARCR